MSAKNAIFFFYFLPIATLLCYYFEYSTKAPRIEKTSLIPNWPEIVVCKGSATSPGCRSTCPFPLTTPKSSCNEVLYAPGKDCNGQYNSVRQADYSPPWARIINGGAPPPTLGLKGGRCATPPHTGLLGRGEGVPWNI